MLNFLMISSLLFFYYLAISYSFAQELPIGRTFVLNESAFGGNRPGTVGVINYPCEEYQHLDSIPASGASLVKDGQLLYAVGGDGTVIEYNLATLPTPAKRTLPNLQARKLALSDSFIVCSSIVPPFIRVLQRSTGNIVFQVDTTLVRNETNDVLIVGNKAFVTVNGNGGFGINKSIDSLVAVINLDSLRFERNITVQPNPVDMVALGNRVFIQCLDYVTGLKIIELDAERLTVSRRYESGILSYGGFMLQDSMIYFNRSLPFDSTAILRTSVDEWAPEVFYSGTFYALAQGPRPNTIFASLTDFSTTGSVVIVSPERVSTAISTFISPIKLVFESIESPAFPFNQTDTLVCTPGPADWQQVFLKATPGFAAYRWSNGSSLDSTSITQAGPLTVDLTLSNGCVLQDSINIQFRKRPEVKFTIMPEILSIISPVTIEVQYPTRIFSASLRYSFIRDTMAGYSVESSSNQSGQTIKISIEDNIEDTLIIRHEVSDSFCISVDTLVIPVERYSIRDELIKTYSNLSISPNPTTGTVNIRLDDFKSQNISAYQAVLTNVQGQQIWTSPLQSIQSKTLPIDLSHLPIGTYFLTVSDGVETKQAKVLLVK